MPEQVPEIQEAIERQPRERGSPGSSIERTAASHARSSSVDPWLWILVAASVAGLVVVAVAQAWLFRRPQPRRVYSLLFGIAFMILGASWWPGSLGSS